MSASIELVKKVENVIDQIRPHLMADGGNIKFIEVTDDNVVKVELLGACSCCPMRVVTLKQGVEEAIISAIPEIKSVEAINS